MRTRTLLAIDLGTTAVKCALYDTHGRLVAENSVEYPLSTAPGGIVEVDVEVYWAAIRDCLASLWATAGADRGEVRALSLSAQGETLVPVNTTGRALRPAIVWLDNRAAAESAELAELIGVEQLYSTTGQPAMMATWPAAKIRWLNRHEPQITARTHRYLLIEDYLLHRLTGEYVTEGSLATSTCYWNFRTKQWWPKMLELIGTGVDQLPDIVEPGAAIGAIRPAVAEELGLPAGMLVCAGALDQACGAIGAGNIAPGGFSENTGAAIALCATVDGPQLDPAGVVPSHYHGIPDHYMFHTFSGGGIVLKWFRDTFSEPVVASAAERGIDPYDALGELAATVAPGADGLLMLPHLQGAMAPENNEHARGVLLGLTLQHSRAHVVRAIMESIAFVVRRNIEAFSTAGVQVADIRALGGGSRSPVWKQMEADISGLPVHTMQYTDAGTLGAAILAGVGAGEWADVTEGVAATVRIATTYEPSPVTAAVYADRYSAYVDAYRALVPTFAAMAN